jgi:hypothetical protein
MSAVQVAEIGIARLSYSNLSSVLLIKNAPLLLSARSQRLFCYSFQFLFTHSPCQRSICEARWSDDFSLSTKPLRLDWWKGTISEVRLAGFGSR